MMRELRLLRALAAAAALALAGLGAPVAEAAVPAPIIDGSAELTAVVARDEEPQAPDDGDDGADSGNTGECPDAQAATKPVGLDGTESLYRSLPFPVGAAVTSAGLTGGAGQVLAQNFNQVTPENWMKPEAWYDDSHAFVADNPEANAVMDWARASSSRVYGHVLVWHSQIPDWFFQHDDGTFLSGSSEADRAELRQRMRAHIFNVARYLSDRYGAFGSETNPLVAFDVVNEVISDSSDEATGGLRDSYWFQILGEEFIDLAFQYADEAFNITYAAPGANRPVRLFINEYNTENGTGAGTKAQRYHDLVARLLARGVPLDGVGHQFHLSMAADVENLAAAMSSFDDLDVVQAVTELDVTTGTPVTEDLLRSQGAYYKRAFEIFRAQDAVRDLFSVTTWGINDGASWRSCDGSPLLFDNDYDGKWAYIGALGGDVPSPARTMTVFSGEVAVDEDATRDSEWAYLRSAPVGEAGRFQARWSSDVVTVLVEVTDSTAEDSDAVTLTLDGAVHTIPRRGALGAEAVIAESATGWALVAALPAPGLAEGQTHVFEVAITDGSTTTNWNDPGATGSITLVGDLATVDVPAAATVPVVDGTAESVWDQGAAVETSAQVEGTGGATAGVRLLWADGDDGTSTLYVLADVEDSTPDSSSSNVYERDSVEIFLDLGNLKSGAYGPDDMQVRVGADGSVSWGTGNVAEMESRVSTAVSNTSGGYTVEAAIRLLDRGGAGSVHGLSLQVNDGVNGSRQSVRAWGDPTGMSWRSTSRWGAARLLPPGGSEPSDPQSPGTASQAPTAGAQTPEVHTFRAAAATSSSPRKGTTLARTGMTVTGPVVVAALLLVAGAAVGGVRRRQG